MPAGDLITGDWQAELRTTLMGATTNYEFRSVHAPPAEYRTTDVPKLLGDGTFGGKDFKGPIVVTIEFVVKGTSDVNLQANLDTLEGVWARSHTDLEFVLRLPNWGTKGKKISGRPRRFDPGTFEPSRQASFRQIGVRAQFEGLTPTWTTVS